MAAEWISACNDGGPSFWMQYCDAEGNGKPPHYLPRLPAMSTTNATASSLRQTLNGQGVLRISGKTKIGTWNVRSLYQGGKMQNVLREMDVMGLDILGLSEVRWTDSGIIQKEKATLLFSGGQTHSNGVGVILSNKFADAVEGFKAHSDRVMIVKLNTKPIKTNIIQVYAPTSDSSDVECEEFYDQLEDILKLTKPHEITIVMGDWNAKVGRGREDDIVGPFGLGTRNERGDRLIDFCSQHGLTIANTWCNQPPRRLYTWTSPRDGRGSIIRNQIDYMIINKRFRNMITSTKTYPGADCNTDHNIVVSKIKLKLKKTRKKNNKKRKLDLDKLKLESTAQEVSRKIEEGIRACRAKTTMPGDIEGDWQQLKDIIVGTTEKIIGYKDNNKKKDWMTDHILELMDERKKFKNSNQTRYKTLNKQIQKEIKMAKEDWMKEKCEEMEQLQKCHNTKELHKRIKEMKGKTPYKPGCLEKSDGSTTIEKNEIIEEWEKYVQDLYHDVRNHKDPNCKKEGPEILEVEVRHAIKCIKTGRSTGPDGIPIEIIKNIGDEGIKQLTKILNNIYKRGEAPKDFNCSITIPIPKKQNTHKPSEHRTLSLLNHTSKILLKIIHNRIYKKIEHLIGNTQFGFRNGVGTREAIFSLSQLAEKSIEMNTPLYLCFVDYEKAFDKVQHDKLMEILYSIGLDTKDINIIKNAYWNQKTKVRIADMESEWIDIKRGVRQGCTLSPLLFNLYAEKVIQDALGDREEGLKINGVIINNLRYADDTVIIATSQKELQNLITELAKISEAMGLKINTKKTKTMCINKKKLPFQIKCNNTNIEQVDCYCYLGKHFYSDNDQNKEIRSRIGQAKSKFNQMRNILCESKLDLQLRIKMLKCYIWPVLLYGSETWTVKREAHKKLESFEMWCFRRILKIKWTSRTTNEEVLEKANSSRQLMQTIKRRKLAYCGHILRGDQYYIPQLTLEGKLSGKRSRGRKRKGWMDDLKEWLELETEDIIHDSRDREQWYLLAANLPIGEGTR